MANNQQLVESNREVLASIESAPKTPEIRIIGAAQYYWCTQCDTPFTSKSALKNHTATCKSSHNAEANGDVQSPGDVLVCCKYCSKTFNNAEILKQHVQHWHKGAALGTIYSCHLCNKTFPEAAQLSDHIIKHGSNEANAKTKVFTCDLCKEQIKGLWNLTNHMCRCHIKQKDLICKQCEMLFYTQSELSRHIHSHLSENPLSCPVCGLAHNMPSMLKLHLRDFHKVKRLYTCRDCDKTFTNVTSFNQHSRIHMEAEKFQCSVCSKRFRKKHVAMSHLATHLDVKPYKCDMCPRTFAWQHGLKLHQRWHKGELPYRCHYCNHGFAQSSALQAHLRSHSGEKPYKCDFCCRSFVNRSSLNSHTRQHTGEKPYQCLLCVNKHRFTNRYSLVTHLKKLHGQLPNKSNYMYHTDNDKEDNEAANGPTFKTGVAEELLQVSDTIQWAHLQ